MKYDIVIIGSGITGTSIAYKLAHYKLNVLVLEKENDVADSTTKANSGIIHGGYDPKENTLMAKYNVKGNKVIRQLAKDLNVHFKEIGSLVVGKKETDKEKIDTLYNRGLYNKVEGLSIIDSKEELHKLEPNLNPDLDYALFCKTASIISPWELALALAYTAKTNGVEFKFNADIKDINRINNSYFIKCNDEEIETNYIINCAGLHCDDIYKLALKDKQDESFKITPIKGEYYLLDKDQGNLVSHVIFQVPSEKGKGVLVSPTVHGNLIVGPDSNECLDKDDTSNTKDGLDYVKNKAKDSVSNINFGSNIRNFTGVRATIKGYDDFFIKESDILPHFINFAGIKSPGLSSAIAFADDAINMLKEKIKLVEKTKFKLYPLPTYFKDIPLKAKSNLYKNNKDYGEVICRCETITLAEIKNAIHAPLGATTIDGIKRRTNSGMGRCQGGFCGPKIYEILKEELHLNFDEVYQDKQSSKVVVDKTKEGR